MTAHRDPDSVPLIRLERAGLVESLHRGRFVLLEGDTVRAHGGDIEQPVFVRSMAKPIQALVGVTSGAAARFDLDDACLAVAAGSHSATTQHVETVQRILRHADVDADALACGGHWSIEAETARAQQLPDGCTQPPALWSNCSGKHAMMLAASRALDAPTDGYLAEDHPTQIAILEHFARMSGVPREALHVGIDGCGVPAPALSLVAAARALLCFARPEHLDDTLRDAARRVGTAMRKHPDMVAGPRRFDTNLCVASEGRVVSKCGAEGVLGLVVADRNLALVVKVEDGSDRGYQHFVIALLERLGVLTKAQVELLSSQHASTVIRNHAGTPVGTAHVVLPTL